MIWNVIHELKLSYELEIFYIRSYKDVKYHQYMVPEFRSRAMQTVYTTHHIISWSWQNVVQKMWKLFLQLKTIPSLHNTPDSPSPFLMIAILFVLSSIRLRLENRLYSIQQWLKTYLNYHECCKKWNCYIKPYVMDASFERISSPK